MFFEDQFVVKDLEKPSYFLDIEFSYGTQRLFSYNILTFFKRLGFLVIGLLINLFYPIRLD